MADIRKYQTDELLNKVLNSGEDALNVDIDNVTLTTEGGDVAIDVALDKANDSVTVYANTAADGSGTSTVPLVDAAGHVQVDIISSALPSGGATAANQSTIIGHVDGVETLLTGIDADTDAIKTDAAAIEVLLTAANVDHAANEALLTTIDADTGAIKTAVETIDNAISGTEMQVDVVASLPAGSAAIGKLAANSGVDIGDVDVTSIVPGTGATNLGKAEDAAHSDGDTGVMALAVRNDVLESLGGSDGDYAALQVTKTGSLNVTETVGHLGAIFEDGTDNITSKKVVAIQFIEDTTFTTLTPVDSSYIGTASGNGDAIDTSNTFPQGMTIFGRWTGFRLASGTIVAYQGDW